MTSFNEGRITIDQAIAQTLAVATAQGVLKDVALTALLVDTEGNATVAQQLDTYVNGWTYNNNLTDDIATALGLSGPTATPTLTPAQAVDNIHDAIAALGQYAPAHVHGSVEMNFSALLASVYLDTGRVDPSNALTAPTTNAFQDYVQDHNKLELAVGVIAYEAQNDLSHALPFARNVAQREGLPSDLAVAAVLAYLPAGSADAANVINQLRSDVTSGSWFAPSPMVSELQTLIQNTNQINQYIAQGYGQTTLPAIPMDLATAASLIQMVTDTMAHAAPQSMPAGAHLTYCKVLQELQFGGPSNIGPTLLPQLNQLFPNEMKLGDVVNAAGYGFSNPGAYASASDPHRLADAAESNALYWCNHDGVPQVYAYLSTLAYVPGDTAYVVGQIAAGLTTNNGQMGPLERDIASLVQGGKITPDQAVQAITDAVTACANANALPLGMPADQTRAYALAQLSQLATTQHITTLSSYLQTTHAADLAAGAQTLTYLATHTITGAAQAAWAAFDTQVHLGLDVASSLASGHATIQSVMTAEHLSAAQAEQALFTLASNGSIPRQVALTQLESLITSASLNPVTVVNDLSTALQNHTINADAGITLMLGLAERTAATDSAVHSALDQLVSLGTVTAAQVVASVYNGIVSHSLTDNQGVLALAMLGASANTLVSNAAAATLGTLIQAGQVDLNAAITALHNATQSVTAGIPALITQAQEVATLLSLAQITDSKGQIAIAAELGHVTGVDLIAALQTNVTSHVLSADTALGVLAALASANTTLQSQVTTEVANLVRTSQVTADHAMSVLTGFAVAQPGTQAAVNAAITGLVAAGVTTAAHVVDVLAHLAPGTPAAMQHAITEEIAALVSSGRITAATVCQTLSGFALNSAATMQAALGAEIAGLVTHGLIDPATALSSLLNNARSNASGYAVLAASMIANGNADLQHAAASQLVSTIANSAGSIAGWIDAAVTSHALTADQAVTALGNIAAAAPTNAAFTSMVTSEFNTLINRGDTTAAAAMLGVIHATTTPNIALLTTLANNNNAMFAGIGQALTSYAVEKGQTSTQIFNLLSVTTSYYNPFAYSYGSSHNQLPSGELLAIAVGMLATATGDLQANATTLLNSLLNVSTNGYSSNSSLQAFQAVPADLGTALAVLTQVGIHADGPLRATVMSAIDTLSDHLQGSGFGSTSTVFNTSVLSGLLGAAGHTGDGLQFVADAVSALINHGQNGQAMLDFIAQSTHGVASYWGQAAAPALLAQGDALTLLTDLAAGISAPIRASIADTLLNNNYFGGNAQALMASHLSDGLAEAIIVAQIGRGLLDPAQGITTLTGLMNTFMHNNPTADASVLRNVSMAHLDLALHAAIGNALSAQAVQAAQNVSAWSHPDPLPATYTGPLNTLLAQINSTANLQTVLTGLGMLQMAQSTASGLNDVLNMAHQAIIDYTMAGAVSSSSNPDAQAHASANAAGQFFVNGFDLLAAHWSAAGILKNEVMAHPDNYHAWIDLGSRLAGSKIASDGVGVMFGKYYTAMSIGGGAMAALFESDAVVHALGKNEAAALAAPCEIGSAGCAGLSAMFSGMVNVGATSGADAAIGLFDVFSDIHSGKNASADAQKFGNNLLQLFSGMQSSDVKNAGVDMAYMFTGDKTAAANFGTDLGNMLYTNNAYMQAAAAAASTAAGSIAHAASNFGSAVVGTALDLGNDLKKAADAMSSY